MTLLDRIVAWSGAAEFGNTWDERHAFDEGVFAGVRCRDPSFELDCEGLPARCPAETKMMLRREHHYFQLGYTLGWAAEQQSWAATAEAVVAIIRFWWTYRPV